MLNGGNKMDDIIYFDNAATTFPKPEEVYRFMDSFYRECGVNVGRGQHKLAAKAAALVSNTRKLLLELNHCPNRAVVFTPSATEALNIIINSVVKKDEFNVYLSPFEHNAVVRTINHLKQVYNITVHTLAFDKNDGIYELEKIEKQFCADKPDAVIISHASNVCGVIAPIVEICSLSKKYDAVNIIDMCQTMGLINCNLNNDNIDYAVFAAHKTLYGAIGLGGFICRHNTKLEPLIYGGTGIDSANLNLPDTIPERYEVGSPNISAIAGLNASLKWIDAIGKDNIYIKEQDNRKQLLNIIAKYDNIKTIFVFDESIGVVSCVFDGYSSDVIGQVLSDNNIAIRTGLHCSPNAHRFIGTFPAGTVRFSVSYFNTREDFEKLDKALEYIHKNS